MDYVVHLFVSNPLLLLFVVMAIGYPLGRIRIAGTSLGVAAMLFAGLLVGSLHPDLQLPEPLYMLGLLFFIYTLGLSSGTGFFASFRRSGLRDSAIVIGVLLFGAAALLLAQRVLGFGGPTLAGMFSGSFTNTPALAGALNLLRSHYPADQARGLGSDVVVAYSITYPMGVVAMLMVMRVAQRLFRPDFAAEAEALRAPGAGPRLNVRTVRVIRDSAAGKTVADLVRDHELRVSFGRIKRGSELVLATSLTPLQANDLVSVVGSPEELDRATAVLGETTDEHIEFERRSLDFRHIFVSSRDTVGRKVRDLHLADEMDGVITRVRRGDTEFPPTGDTVLEPGDRIAVVARRESMGKIAQFFGDSYRALSEIDILSFSLGMGLGILVGMVPLPLPRGITVTLGIAGGPLIVGLILGRLGRTGPFVWTLPYSANLTLRQVGLILFLSGVGTRAGYSFFSTLASGGLAIFLAGAAATAAVALATLIVCHQLLKIPMAVSMGMLAGIQTQPALLGYSLDQTRSELPNVGYAAVYPIATIVKVVLAQVLLALLSR